MKQSYQLTPSLMRILLFSVTLCSTICFCQLVAADSSKEGECLVIPTVKLHNGIEMPLLSLGTAQLVTKVQSELPRFVGMLPERAYRQMELALQSGMRAFDTVRVHL